MNRTHQRARLRLLAGLSGAVALLGRRLEPEGCHLFPADVATPAAAAAPVASGVSG